MYKHQIISLFIIIFCFLICLLIEIIPIIKKKDESDDFFILILYFIVSFGLYSLYDVLTKIHFENYSENQYQLMFYIGLISLILIIIFDFFIYLFEINIFGNDVIKQIKESFSLKNILLFIFGILVGFLW